MKVFFEGGKIIAIKEKIHTKNMDFRKFKKFPIEIFWFI